MWKINLILCRITVSYPVNHLVTLQIYFVTPQSLCRLQDFCRNLYVSDKCLWSETKTLQSAQNLQQGGEGERQFTHIYRVTLLNVIGVMKPASWGMKRRWSDTVRRIKDTNWTTITERRGVRGQGERSSSRWRWDGVHISNVSMEHWGKFSERKNIEEFSCSLKWCSTYLNAIFKVLIMQLAGQNESTLTLEVSQAEAFFNSLEAFCLLNFPYLRRDVRWAIHTAFNSCTEDEIVHSCRRMLAHCTNFLRWVLDDFISVLCWMFPCLFCRNTSSWQQVPTQHSAKYSFIYLTP